MVHPDGELNARTWQRPFKIHFEHFLESNTTKEDQDYLTTKLLPTTAAVLKQYVQVRTTCLYLYTCGMSSELQNEALGAMQVRRPVPGGILRITPPCEGWKICTDGICQTICQHWHKMECGNVTFPDAHLDELRACSNCSSAAGGCATTGSDNPPSFTNCTSSPPGPGMRSFCLKRMLQFFHLSHQHSTVCCMAKSSAAHAPLLCGSELMLCTCRSGR